MKRTCEDRWNWCPYPDLSFHICNGNSRLKGEDTNLAKFIFYIFLFCNRIMRSQRCGWYFHNVWTRLYFLRFYHEPKHTFEISLARHLTDFLIWSVVISGFLAFVSVGGRKIEKPDGVSSSSASTELIRHRAQSSVRAQCQLSSVTKCGKRKNRLNVPMPQLTSQ